MTAAAPSIPLLANGPPPVRVGGHDAHVTMASREVVRFVVPQEVEGGTVVVHIAGMEGDIGTLEVGRTIATELQQVDSPAFDGLGRLYATDSGSRGAKAAVPLFRINQVGSRDAIRVEIANPTALALGPDGAMYVSSRFEGTVYRLTADDRLEVYASELGVPTGLAFSPDGALFVGDRSGSVFRISPGREVELFATLPASVAAFHLAFGPDLCLYVAAPTLASHDPLYRITPDRLIDTVFDGFGRPQGLAFDRHGRLYVADAMAGGAGLYRLDLQAGASAPELLLSAPRIIGLCFDPEGGLVVASNDTIWRLAVDLHPFNLP